MGVVCGGDPNKEAMHQDIEEKLKVHIKEWPEAVMTFKRHYDHNLENLWTDDDSDIPAGILADKRKVRAWYMNDKNNKEQSEFASYNKKEDVWGAKDGRSIVFNLQKESIWIVI